MLITNPMTRRSAPPWCMCRGVITITLTITACPRATVTSPSNAAGFAAATRRPRATDPWCSRGSTAAACARSALAAADRAAGEQPAAGLRAQTR